MQVLKVDSETTIMYKIIITVLLKHILFLIAPLFCILNKHHCCRLFFFNLLVLFLHCTDERSSLSPSRGLPRFTDCLGLTLSFTFSFHNRFHVILALQGQQVFSWVIHTYMVRRVRYPIFFIQNLHVAGTGAWWFDEIKKKSLDSCANPSYPAKLLVFFSLSVVF